MKKQLSPEHPFLKLPKKKVTCKKCGYSWETTSQLDFVTCVKCQRKTKIV